MSGNFMSIQFSSGYIRQGQARTRYTRLVHVRPGYVRLD